MILYWIESLGTGSTGIADNEDQVWRHVENLGKIGFIDSDNVVVVTTQVEKPCTHCPNRDMCDGCEALHPLG